MYPPKKQSCVPRQPRVSSNSKSYESDAHVIDGNLSDEVVGIMALSCHKMSCDVLSYCVNLLLFNDLRIILRHCNFAENIKLKLL
jgi:hypothetical protein